MYDFQMTKRKTKIDKTAHIGIQSVRLTVLMYSNALSVFT